MSAKLTKALHNTLMACGGILGTKRTRQFPMNRFKLYKLGFLERHENGGWRITAAGRAALTATDPGRASPSPEGQEGRTDG